MYAFSVTTVTLHHGNPQPSFLGVMTPIFWGQTKKKTSFFFTDLLGSKGNLFNKSKKLCQSFQASFLLMPPNLGSCQGAKPCFCRHESIHHNKRTRMYRNCTAQSSCYLIVSINPDVWLIFTHIKMNEPPSCWDHVITLNNCIGIHPSWWPLMQPIISSHRFPSIHKADLAQS